MAQIVSSRLLYLAICFVLPTVISSVSARSRRNVNFACPKDCHCYANYTFDTTTVQCTSLNFLTKLSQKESAMIISLDLSKLDLSTVDYRLKKLMNLQILNMSGNKLTKLRYFPHLPKLTHLNLRSNSIKSLSTKYLPTTLRALDISHNDIEELPQDILRLQNLRRIDVSGNPFSCNRESLDIRDMLLERDVHIGGHVICISPVKFKGQSWMHAVDLDDYIKYQEDMQGDMPFYGSGDSLPSLSADTAKDENQDLYFSGSGDTEISMVDATSTSEPNISVEEEILVRHKVIPDTRAKDQTEYLTPESHYSSTVEPNLKYVEEFIDSTTEHAIRVPSSTFEPGTIVKDVTLAKDLWEPSSITSEPNFRFVDDNVVSTTEPDIRVFNAGPATNGADVSSDKNLGTNIFLVVFLLCLLLLIVYAFKKNKDKKRKARLNAKRQPEKNVTDTELQPMKPKETPNEKHNGNSASLPLINAPNGNTKAIEANEYQKEEEVLRKQPSLSAETEPAGDISYSPTYPDAPAYPSNLNVKSVTVRAHEIPDSVPHTPILVNRSRSEDGTHVVVIPDARSSQLDE